MKNIKRRMDTRQLEKVYLTVARLSALPDPHVEEGKKIGQEWGRSFCEVSLRYKMDLDRLKERMTLFGELIEKLTVEEPTEYHVNIDFGTRIFRLVQMKDSEKKHDRRFAYVWDMGAYCEPPKKLEIGER